MEPVRLSRADWPHYKREALIAGVALVIGIVLAGIGHHLYKTADQARRQAEASLQAARDNLSRAENERSEIVASLPLYRNLLDRSIIGNEQRLNWHETLKAEQQKHALDNVAFSLAPRQAFSVDAAGSAVMGGLFRRYRSTMKLNVEFQNETAFVDFLDGVAQRAHALTVIRGCQISRTGGSGPAPLAAECIIDWATLERTAPAGKAGSS